MRFAVVYVVKKPNYIMREIPEQERESYSEKDQIILCLF